MTWVSIMLHNTKFKACQKETFNKKIYYFTQKKTLKYIYYQITGTTNVKNPTFT